MVEGLEVLTYMYIVLTLISSVIVNFTHCRNDDGEFVSTATNKRRNGSILLAKVLQYLDCPQYLRKSFFPQQPDLKYAGRLSVLTLSEENDMV